MIPGEDAATVTDSSTQTLCETHSEQARNRRETMSGYFAYITVLEPGQIGGIGGPRPDQGLPGPQPPFPGSGNRPDNTLPGQPGYPSHPIYNPPYPDQGLPGQPPYPDQGLPGHQPGPDHGLPPFPSHPIAPGGGGSPPQVGFPGGPGQLPSHGRWVWHPIYGWVWEPSGAGGGQPGGGNPPYPDQGLPGHQPGIDNTLPGSQPHPDQGLPRPPSQGTRPPPQAGQLPSTPIATPQNVTPRPGQRPLPGRK
jgi:hypothetical protein